MNNCNMQPEKKNWDIFVLANERVVKKEKKRRKKSVV